MPEFTKNQLAAIDISRLGEDACIVAGPGSGKTTVLVERYRQLVGNGVLPRQILAITFTEKAAASMKLKVSRAFASDPSLRRQVETAYISTVHGFCQRLLKENAIAAGVDPQFGILDERQGQIRRARCAVETLDAFYRERTAETRRLMAAIDEPELADALVQVHDAIRSAGVSIDSLFAAAPPDMGKSLDDICGIIENYRRFNGYLTPRRLEYRADLVAWAQRARAAFSRDDWQMLVGETAAIRFLPGSVHPNAKDEFVRAQNAAADLLGAAVARLYEAERRTVIEILLRFDRHYAQEKQKLGVLDFADLEHFAIRLLQENAAVRQQVQSQFRQILMDEYQDTNGQQATLLALLRAPGNFYAVGDVNQSIFGFRYATPDVFRHHLDEVRANGGHHAELFDNFRSREEILLGVEAVLADAPGVRRHTLHARRDLPAKQQPSIEVAAAMADDRENVDRESAERIEAGWVASRILALRGSLTIGSDSRPADFRDMAVLLRKASLAGPLLEAFDRYGVQYQVTRQIGFFESREIRDLTHLLRAISNPRDEVSLAAVLRSPLAGLSDEALFRLKLTAHNLGSAMDSVVDGLDPMDADRWARFRGNFARWRSRVHHIALDRLLAEAMDDCGYNWAPGTSAGANIEKLLSLARNAPRGQSLADFVHEIKLIREDDAREADAPFDEALNAVRVITAHASKGLEFPIVFIPGLQARMSKSLPALTFTTAGGLGAKWGGHPDWFRIRNKAAIREREEHESNRLLYVAMTRAEEHLVLSYALGAGEKAAQWAEPVSRILGDRLQLVTETPAAVARESGGAFAGNLVEVARPELTGQEDSSVAVTSLALFADCPRRYYLSRYLGWDDHVSKAGGGKVQSSELGRQVHALLASQQVPDAGLEAIHLAATFERSALGRRASKARHVEHEYDFMFAMEGMVLHGQIDLWFEDRAGQIIVDYKTDDVAPHEVESRSAAYKLQLRYYALAIEKLTGAPPTEAWLHFLRPDVAVRVEVTRRDVEAAKALLREFAAAQRSLAFPLRVTPRCLRCPFYRGKCPALFLQQEVAAEQGVDSGGIETSDGVSRRTD